MIRLKRRFLMVTLISMCIALKALCMNVNAEEKAPDPDIGKKKLLVAIDNSGSMRPLDPVVQEVLQMIFALENLDPDSLSVEYLLFNAEGTKQFSLSDGSALSLEEKIKNGEKIIDYHGETSVYIGFEKMNEWVEANKEQEKNGSISLLVLSDLYSSRDKNGNIFTKKSANWEQHTINTWILNWRKLIRDDILNVLFIHWESMTPGESMNHTLDYVKEGGDVDGGYQVILDKKLIKEFLADEVQTRGDINSKAEQEIVGEAACYLFKMIKETDKLFWREAGVIQKPDMSVQIGVPRDKKVFIRIDKEDGKSGVKAVYNKTGQECPVEICLEGSVIEIYYAEELEQRVLEIQAEQEGGFVKLNV